MSLNESPFFNTLEKSLFYKTILIINFFFILAARLFAQRSKKGQAYEMIHDLDKMVLSLLQAYFAKNNAYPKKIVFYRDGVSEGQFPLVNYYFEFF